MKKDNKIININEYKLKKEELDKATYSSIIAEIVGGLTGDKDEDISYLEFQMEKYRSHEFGIEIIKECSRIMTSKYPDAISEEIAKGFDSLDIGIRASLDEIDMLLAKGDIEKAYDLLFPIVELSDGLIKSGFSKEDKVNKYYSFESALEVLLYQMLNPTYKDFRPTILPYSRIYLKYGYILIEMGKIEDAQKVLEKAMLFNPMDANIVFEHAEIFKNKKMFDEMYQLTKNAINMCYRASQVARYYRNIGYYFIEKKKYKAAQVCYLLSLNFDSGNLGAVSELAWIDEKNDGDVLNTAKATSEDIENCCKEYGIPCEEDFIAYNSMMILSAMAMKNPRNENSIMVINECYWAMTKENRPLIEQYRKKIAQLLVNLQDVKEGKKLKTKYKTIKFGKTGQFNLDIKEDIEWLVLEEDDEKMLLLSKYIIDAKEYSDEDNCSWEKSSLRKYLNKEFIDECFNKKEKEKIIETKLINSKISKWEIDNCKDTKDKIFCLSMAEIEKYFPDKYEEYGKEYDVDLRYFINKELATFGNNKAMLNNGLYVSDEDKWYKGNSYYWTRSVSAKNKMIVPINEDGSASDGIKNNNIIGVRPAMWVKK